MYVGLAKIHYAFDRVFGTSMRTFRMAENGAYR